MNQQSLIPEQQIKKFHTLWWLAGIVIIAGLLALAVSVVMMSTGNLDKRLARLEAQENDVATTDTLSALQSDIKVLRDGLEDNRKSVAALQQQVTAQASRDEAVSLRPSLIVLQKTQQAQEKRLDVLMAQFSTLKTSEAKPAPEAKKIIPAKSRSSVNMPAPPFVLIGVEKRGTEFFAAVASHGYSSLKQIALIGEGETVSGWTLVRTGDNEATFRVNGRPAVLKVPE